MTRRMPRSRYPLSIFGCDPCQALPQRGLNLAALHTEITRGRIVADRVWWESVASTGGGLVCASSPFVLRTVGRHRNADEVAGLAQREIGVPDQLHRQNG